MGLYEQRLADGAQSIEIFAEISGADPEEGNILIAGATEAILGMFGDARVTYVPVDGGGMRKKTEVLLEISKESLAQPPKENTAVVRTDMTPHVIFNVAKINTQHPIFWQITLVSFAA